MGIVLESFAQFMPALFLLNVVGILWDFAYSAWRGRF